MRTLKAFSLLLGACLAIAGTSASSSFGADQGGVRVAACVQTTLAGCSIEQSTCLLNCNRQVTGVSQPNSFMLSCRAGCQNVYIQCRQHAGCQ
jgi:hypothetical protein